MDQEQLVQLLKKKGTGATMSKHLTESESKAVVSSFKNDSLDIVTRATLFVATLILPETEEEKIAFSQYKKKPNLFLPDEFLFLIDKNRRRNTYEKIVTDVVSGIDLNAEKMRVGMEGVYGTVPEYLAAMFLEAERLKRETPIENKVALQVQYEKSVHKQVNVELLIDLSLGYDGFNRTPFLSIFLAPVLASMGFPTVCHGVQEIGPKFGITFHKVLEIANKDPLKPIDNVIQDIENTGWGYVDQEVYASKSAGLNQLRKGMVKRPVLATTEKLVQPIRSKDRNYIVTGYTHPPYKEKMINLLRERQEWTGFIVCRGVEGSIQLPLDRRAPFISSENDTSDSGDFVKPDEWGIEMESWPSKQGVDSNKSLKVGLEALSGKKGVAYNTLVYMATAITSRLKLLDSQNAYSKAKEAIDSGCALDRFNAIK